MSLYLNHFCDIVHPDVLSYDYYPFIYRSYTGAIEVNDSDFYYNLQLFARLSKQKDIPFWAFCQSTNIRNCKIDDPNYTEHPEATENFLRYEAFSALAFGAKGINYWRYSDCRDDYSHVTKDSTYSLYLSALTDTLGNCEPAWKCAQAVNLEIKRHEQMFLNAELMSYSFLDSNLNKNLYVRPTDGADIPEYDGAIHISKITGKGVLASRLFDGIDNLILVNLDPFNTTTVKVGYSTDKVRRIFMKCDVICHAIPGGGGIIGPIVNPTDPDDPSISINYPKYKSEEFKLKPGGYAILHYATSSSANENGDETDNK